MDKLNKEQVKEFWDERAVDKNLTEKSVTYDDIYRRELEIEIIKDNIPKECSSLLDVGCGAGYGTIQYASNSLKTLGIDFSDKMIAKAEADYGWNPNIKFQVHDITKGHVLNPTTLHEVNFQCIISQRALQNIPDRNEQYRAIRTIHSMLEPGGIYIMCESLTQPRIEINKARKLFQLPEIPEVKFNTEFKNEEIFDFLDTHFAMVDEINFGLYDFVSKVIYPASIYPDKPKFDSIVNKGVAELLKTTKHYLQGFEEFSKTPILVLRKKI